MLAKLKGCCCFYGLDQRPDDKMFNPLDIVANNLCIYIVLSLDVYSDPTHK